MEETRAVLHYGTTEIPVRIQRSRRTTLGIIVEPDGIVTLRAPEAATLEKVLERAGRKAAWIGKQLRTFEELQRSITHRPLHMEAGESIPYLGRKYRLKIEEGRASAAVLKGRHLWITVRDKGDKPRIARTLESWYRSRAKKIFAQRLERLEPLMRREGIEVKGVLVRHLQYRWGSCTARGALVLNYQLVQAPLSCIDYVLMHELCHLKHLNHGPAFRTMLGRLMPDWVERKARLNAVTIGTFSQYSRPDEEAHRPS